MSITVRKKSKIVLDREKKQKTTTYRVKLSKLRTIDEIVDNINNKMYGGLKCR